MKAAASEHSRVGGRRLGTPRAWRRVALAVLIMLSIVGAFWHSDVALGELASKDGVRSAAGILSGLSRPDLSAGFLHRIAGLALESLLIGVLGTALALVLGIGLAVLAARLPTLAESPDAPWAPGVPRLRRIAARHRRHGRGALRLLSRAVLAFFRAVPEIVWAYLFVRIFGLGPGPAVLALALSCGGAIGKLYAELIEAVDPGPGRRLRAAGASWLAVLVYGVLPLVRAQWTRYALFRLECAIRSASILGVVGAGGLGAEIDLSIRYFQYDKLATALMAVLAYVVLLDIVSAWLGRAGARLSAMLLAIGAALAAAYLPIPWSELASAQSGSQLLAFLRGFAAPTRDAQAIFEALSLSVLTVSMAWAATMAAGMLAFVLAPLSAWALTAGSYLVDPPRGRDPWRWMCIAWLGCARLVIQVTRALPELVWALLFVVWVGPGTTAGVLALAVHTIGIFGRLYNDVLAETEPEPPRHLEALGSGALGRYVYGVLPQALPRMLAFTLYRFEVNIRAAAMVGFVGAGGLGDALHTAISLFHMRDLAMLLLVLLAVVWTADAIGDRVRLRAWRM